MKKKIILKRMLAFILCLLLILEIPIMNLKSYGTETGNGDIVSEEELLPIDTGTETPTPTIEVSPTPKISPTVEPTIKPLAEPTVEPTEELTPTPTIAPPIAPTDEPTPTVEPTPILYTVTYHFNGASYNDSVENYVVQLEENSEHTIIDKSNLVFANNDFLGWYSSANFSGDAIGTTITVTSNIDLYAKWQPYYTVTYHLNGAKYNNNANDYVVKINQGENVTIIDKNTLSYDGMRFFGWYDNSAFTGNQYTGTITPTSNVELFAKWDVQKYIKITFYPNDNSGLDSYESESLACGSTETLPYVEKAGYKLVGWYVVDGDTNYGTGSFTVPETNVSLYAKWEIDPNAKVTTITLKSNVVSNDIFWNTSENNSYFYVNEGANFYNSLPTPMLNGYEFKGWYSDSNCTKLLTQAECTSSKTIYAKFEESKITITYQLPTGVKIVENGGLVTKSSWTIKASDNEEIVFPIPYKENHRYVGWRIAGSTDEPQTSGYVASTITPNVTFEPVFTSGIDEGLLFCLESRSVHYLDIKDNNSRCPFCGHTTYEVLYCAAKSTNVQALTGCTNAFYGKPHTFNTIAYNAPCLNGPTANCGQTLQDVVVAVFPDSTVSFEFSCSGDFSHNFVANTSGKKVCSYCGMDYDTWLKAYNEQNPTTSTQVGNPKYKGKYPEKTGEDTFTVIINGRPFAGPGSNGHALGVNKVCTGACWHCWFTFEGPYGPGTAWRAQCLDCKKISGTILYYNYLPNTNYTEYYCPNGSCRKILQGAGFGTHDCKKTETKAYTITFDENLTFPKNSRNESPSTSKGTNTTGLRYWGTNYTTPNITTWVGYTTDKWMYGTQTIQNNVTYYLDQNTQYSRLANHDSSITFYARHIPYKYNVTFNFNRPETTSSIIKVGDKVLGNTVASTTASVNFDDYLTSAINTTDSTMDGQFLSVPTMEGWIFKGWNTKADGTGTTITSETRLTEANMKKLVGSVPANGSTINLYAVWQPVTAKIIFNANNAAKLNEYGTATISGTMASINDVYDSCSPLPNINYTRSYTTYYNQKANYVFTGWLLGHVSETGASNRPNTDVIWFPTYTSDKQRVNKVQYLNVTEGSPISFDSYMNGSITLSQSSQGLYIKNRLQSRYGTLTNDTRTYDGVNIGNTRWDYAFAIARAKATNKAIRFHYITGAPYVTFFNGDNNVYRNIPNGSFVGFDMSSNVSNNNGTDNFNGTVYVDLYAAWAAYNTRPQAFYRFAVKEFNEDGTFTGHLKDYENDSFYGNKTSGNPAYNDNPSSSTTIYDDAYVYLHSAYYDPEQMEKAGDEYQFSVDGGKTWYKLQSGISNKYFDCVATTLTKENIKTTTIANTNGFYENEISGPTNGLIYKLLFKTDANGNPQQVLLRYRAKDSVKYPIYYANIDDYENGVYSELQKTLWSTGYYDSEEEMYETVTFEGQPLKKYKGDEETAGTLTKKDGTKSKNSNENGSWSTKTITIKKGNSIPEVGLNGSNIEKEWYNTIHTAMPMYDYYTGNKNGTEKWNYTNGNIYLLVSQEEENLINKDTSLTGTFVEKVRKARGLENYNNIVVIRESQYKSSINVGNKLSYNSQTLATDNSGTKTNVTGSQYTKYVPGDETIAFMDTSIDKDNKGYGLYFISIIDKDSMTDVLYKSSDTVCSQNETLTGQANIPGKELYANKKSITNGMVYTFKNNTIKTVDSTTGVKGHIFTDYESMIKFIYDRVNAEFPEVSDLYNGQYVVFYAVGDNSWNNMSPMKWSNLYVENFETQPRLSILDSTISSIESPKVTINEPLSLWKDETGSPRYRLNGYTINFNANNVSAYRGTKVTSGSSNRYAQLVERQTQSNTNYVAISANKEKLNTSYAINTGYVITYNVETLGADYVEMSLATKGTHESLPIIIVNEEEVQYDRKYANDTAKSENYLLAYTTRQNGKNSFIYANVPQIEDITGYGYQLTISKKLITKPNTVLQRSIILGEETNVNNPTGGISPDDSTDNPYPGIPPVIVIEKSINQDIGVSITN